MKVGLFGGTFNPPHIAHLLVAESARSQFGLDQVWWIPAYEPPHKSDQQVTEYAHRMEMTRAAIADHPDFVALDVESALPRPSFTINTIRALQARYPEYTYFLIVGSDHLAHLNTWAEPESIVRHAKLLVYPRDGYDLRVSMSYLEESVHRINAPTMGLEGAYVRSLLHQGRSIRYLVCEPVRAYIAEHRLYDAPLEDATDST